jgi:hypothetical protein
LRATAALAEIAEELVRAALTNHPDEKTISLLAISVSHLEKHWKLQTAYSRRAMLRSSPRLATTGGTA